MCSFNKQAPISQRADYFMPEFEMVSHKSTYYLTFIVNLVYRTPHLHSDYEILLVLRGNLRIILEDQAIMIQEGDVFIINPFQRHELLSSSATLLVLQISSQFTRHFFTEFERISFEQQLLQHTDPYQRNISKCLIDIATANFKGEAFSDIKNIGTLCTLLYDLVIKYPYHINSVQELAKRKSNADRLSEITQYIDEHYTEKLLLSDIAKQRNVTTSYLSHFFKDCTGMSFQEYLRKMRCEKARQLLIMTNLSLLDIRISCGFSDSKYFNAGFKKQFGVLPREYRNNFQSAPLKQQQASILSVQKFLSKESGLVLLSRCINALIKKGILNGNDKDSTLK